MHGQGFICMEIWRGKVSEKVCLKRGAVHSHRFICKKIWRERFQKKCVLKEGQTCWERFQKSLKRGVVHAWFMCMEIWRKCFQKTCILKEVQFMGHVQRIQKKRESFKKRGGLSQGVLLLTALWPALLLLGMAHVATPLSCFEAVKQISTLLPGMACVAPFMFWGCETNLHIALGTGPCSNTPQLLAETIQSGKTWWQNQSTPVPRKL